MSKRYYLDHAGATLPSEQQKEAIKTELFESSLVLANPHSHHASGEYTNALVKSARNRVLEFFGSNPSEYAVIFTQNTTHALKTVAECFDFGERTKSSRTISTDVYSIKPGQSHLVMLQDSHTSVAGMRGVADYDHCVVIKDISGFEKFLVSASDAWNSSPSTSSRNLFVLTPMSNFCGRKYDLSVVKRVRKALGPSWAICMDAAAMVGTSPFDLAEAEHPDFVTISFYKMFGYPTGLGALIVRRDRGHLLRKRYFGGGTVNFESPTTFLVDYKDDLSAKLEDGTMNYYAIAALRHGFDDIDRFGGIRSIHATTQRLVSSAYEYLSTATYSNGNPVARIYGVGNGTKEFEKRQGPILNFNLLRDDGTFVGFMEVSKMCDLFSIDVRTGCFCNQGACSLYLGLTDEMMQRNHEMGKVCGDETDLVGGRPVGSVRISFGRTSADEDVDMFIRMIQCCFLNSPSSVRRLALPSASHADMGVLRQIFLYPVKSCGAMQPKRWTISRMGLLYDRNWMVVSNGGVPCTQKRYPALCSIMPVTGDENLILHDRHGIMDPLKINLRSRQKNGSALTTVCVNCQQAVDCGDEVASWLEQFSDSLKGCRLVRKLDVLSNGCSTENGASSTDQRERSFSNQEDYLLINRASIEALAERVGLDVDTVIRRFRPNFVIDAGPESAFAEDNTEEVDIGSISFEVVGPCTRCQMICIDQETGEKNPNILLALRDLRKGEQVKNHLQVTIIGHTHLQLTFGIYLRLKSKAVDLQVVVGSRVRLLRRKCQLLSVQPAVHGHC